jgi:hypothetical protein
MADKKTSAKIRGKQNLTVSLDRRTIQKAKIIAARESTSISELVSRQIDTLVSKDDDYERAKRRAFELLDQGFDLGGEIRVTRDELHER